MSAHIQITKSSLWTTIWYFYGMLHHGDPTVMRESTSVFQMRTINRSKLDKRQVSVDRFPEEMKVRTTFYAFFSVLQNIFEIILFTAPSQNICRCYVNF